jgi:ribosome-binding protein aMBF1 (putative translation factor)
VAAKNTARPPAQIGAAILAARTTAGLSQTELAAKLKTAQQNVQRLEKGGSTRQPAHCYASPKRPAINW